MSVLIKHMAMPKGCMYANDKDQTEYCPLLNHDDVPFCQYIENEPEIAIGIDERPVYCPLSDVPEPCQDTIYRQDAIDAATSSVMEWDEIYAQDLNVRIGEAIQQLSSAQPELPIKEKCAYCPHCENCDVNDDLTITQPEREKGEWIWCGDKHVCSECDEFALCDAYDVLETGEYQEDLSDFCPHCGADMRGLE